MKSKELKQHSVDWLYEQIFELRKGIYPPYQRKDRIWPLEDNQLLIDSILRDYDIQKFYFRVISNDEFEVVDGQQRLKALFSYKCNRFRLPISIEDIDGDSIANCRLCDLEETFQNKFKDTLLDICWLYDYTDIEAANFFQRLQKGVPLVPAEKRHAMIDSNMRNIVTELTKKNEVFKVCDFNNKRFEHEDAIAKILYLHLNGRPTALGHVPMERAYEKYKYLTNDDIAIVELNKALNFVKVAFNNKLKKLNRNGLITLSYLYTILSENYNLNNSKASEFAQSYIDIDDERIYNKEKPVKMQDQEFMKYDLDMRYNSKIHLELSLIHI